MGEKTGIEWTDATWNPVRGCTRVSEGCRNCYAEAVAARFSDPGMAYEGLATRTPSGPRWTGEVRLIEDHLEDPLRWKKPRRIFVNSMSDLFHEGLSDEQIDRVFAVMALAPQHTFQVLTKRAERMHDYLNGTGYRARHYQVEALRLDGLEARRSDIRCEIVALGGREGYNRIEGLKWPLPNVWPMVSVEDQKTANERVAQLLNTPAVVRGVSYEPALGPVEFRGWLPAHIGRSDHFADGTNGPAIDWIICGGESGPGARPFNVQWARDTIAQCKAAGVPVFVKQLGANVRGENANEWDWPDSVRLEERNGGFAAFKIVFKSRKGGDWSEWPEDLRVREYPTQAPVLALS